MEDKHKAGVLGETASSPPLSHLVPAALCPLLEGGALRVGWAQVSQSHLGPTLGCFSAALKCGLGPMEAVMGANAAVRENAPHFWKCLMPTYHLGGFAAGLAKVGQDLQDHPSLPGA